MKQESETKRKLLETAMELIWESSYGSVSVDDICTKAGVNKGSFYYAFKSKSELAAAAFERHWESKRPLLDQVFSSQIPPLDRLKKYCQVVVQDQEEKSRSLGKVLGCPFCSLGGEVSTQDENIRQKLEQMSSRKMKYLEALVRDLAAEGSIEVRDPRELAREIYFYIMGVLMQAKIENSTKGLARMEEGIIRLLNLKQPSHVTT
ncbi:MAG: TetR/AcrR family transcriptional regulator [Methylacidiphilales bacterium]|nr:TetR/AcrR family transcriptional regulator [Candidatus Methylacidiphilales bacterium]